MAVTCARRAALALVVGGILFVCDRALLRAQEPYRFVVSVVDAQGRAVTDLERDEILMFENGVANEILAVESFPIPVAVTIAVDNGPLSRDALSHYRSGLTGLVNALPRDVAVTLVTTAPQPMMVVRPTTDRIRILRGVNGFAPEDDRPRFTDALVEFSHRLRDDYSQRRIIDSLPVLVMVSTTANEAMSYELPEIQRALDFLGTRKARVFVAMLSSPARNNESLSQQINSGRQVLIGIPATEVTRGRYESLATSSRLATLLAEFGTDIAALHHRHAGQLRVLARRQPGLTGPLQNPRIEVTREGVTGQVSLDGLP